MLALADQQETQADEANANPDKKLQKTAEGEIKTRCRQEQISVTNQRRALTDLLQNVKSD